jgi:hypothetical protein
VVPFYDDHSIRLSRMLTDRGTEFCGTQSHEYELYLAVEDIDHSRTKTKSPQTTDVIDKQFLCSAEASRFFVPACQWMAPRAAVVKTGRSPPPQAAWS